MENDDVNNIIDRMMKAAGVKNQSRLAAYINKERSIINGWRKREFVPDDWIEMVALKTGYRKEWIKTGEGEEREQLHIVKESTASFIPGLHFDGLPLSHQEKNELSILRWLEKNKPEIRQRIADEIVEMYILGVRELTKGE